MTIAPIVKKYLLLPAVLFFLTIAFDGDCFAQGKCLIVSDIHYNPDSAYSLQPGHDSNYQLLLQSVKAMKRILPHPGFIIIAGDFIWHGDHKVIPVEKKKEIIATIAKLFRQNFPHVPVVAALGNNDTYQNDYYIQDAAFLNMFANEWQKNGTDVFTPIFRQRGYYIYRPGNKYRKLKFVVLNTALLANGSIAKGYAGKADTMLNWLDNTLHYARRHGEKVWVVSHIPPGDNVYEMLRHQKDTVMWDSGYTQRYIKTMVKYAPQVRFSIASHTHFNDFRVICNAEGKPVSWIRVVPSISPNHYNNPSFEVAQFDRNYNITKESTWYFDLQNHVAADSADFVWKMGLGIASAGLAKISPAGVLDFIHTHNSLQSPVPLNYIRFYNVGSVKESGANCYSGTAYEYLKTAVLKEGN